MTTSRFLGSGLIVRAFIPVLPLPALAQQTSAIAGVVRDTSGAVLPGVTVEAASPVLIEKVRTVVTDDQGRYNIVNLVPGTYRVTFTQNVRKQVLITSDQLDALPTSTKNWATIVEVTPGFAGSFADVAGQLNQNIGNSYHGKTGTKRQFDGMSIGSSNSARSSISRLQASGFRLRDVPEAWSL